jgi:acyl dehydratase
LIEQSRINQFADVTDDHQYIHIDQQRAAETDLGGTIAHGFLVLSLLPKLVAKSLITPENIVMGINYGFDKVRFLNPVRPGDRVRVTGTVLDIVDKGDGRYLQKLGVSLEIEGKDKPAIVCEWLNLFVVG